MIILTSKQLNALKEEIKADLRKEVVAETTNALNNVFERMELVGTLATQEGRKYLLEKDDVTGIAAIVLVEALNRKIKTQCSDQIAQIVTEYVQGEKFVDDVISRINRKQLIGGKQ